MTNGSADGTQRLTDINNGPEDGYAGWIAVVEGRAWFLANSGDGFEIWVYGDESSQLFEPDTCNGLDVTVKIAAGDVPTVGDDVILGTSGPDVINGLAGDDVICGLGGGAASPSPSRF